MRRIFEALLPVMAAAWFIHTGSPWIGFAVLAVQVALLMVCVVLWSNAATVALKTGQDMQRMLSQATHQPDTGRE